MRGGCTAPIRRSWLEPIEETPQKVDDEQYRWKGIGRNHKAAVLHYVPEDRDIHIADTSGSSKHDEVTFVLNYRNNTWMVTVETKSSSTAFSTSLGRKQFYLNV